MSYDEGADIARHEQEVMGLHELVTFLQWPASGYQFGLDVGGGDGLHAPWLLRFVQRLIVSDIKDYLGPSGGLHVANMKEKLERNGAPLDLSRVEFQHADAHSLPYRDGLFDFVVSINAFEHIPDPAKALSEILRVTRPQALVVLQFDPLWHSPFGHHLWHLTPEPWEHLITPRDAFEANLLARGGTEADVDVLRHHMNGLPFHYYKKLFDKNLRHFRQHNISYWARTDDEEPHVAHANFSKALEMGFDREDLMVRGFQFVGICK
jgi:ubiquinone/menaquinone biosynthesis C-methylase UbiE